MTQPICIEVSQVEARGRKDDGRRVNVSGVIRILGVSRNGYYFFENRISYRREIAKERIVEKIIDI